MSVYTRVGECGLKEFLQGFDIGSLVSYQGIAQGVENTNYFLTTTSGSYILTIFENIGDNELPFCLGLTDFLHQQGLPCAHVVPCRSGNLFTTLCSKPASIVTLLSGNGIVESDTTHCDQIGRFLGQMHQLSAQFNLQRKDNRWSEWREQTAREQVKNLKDEDALLLRSEMAEQAKEDFEHLPTGIIHADLFRDNALFDDHKLTGVIDFYNACTGPLLYDLAITVNDWCQTAHLEFSYDKARALLAAYQQERPLNVAEKEMWPMMLRVATMRFWLSRIVAINTPHDDVLVNHKNPNEKKALLHVHRGSRFNWWGE